MTNRFSVLCVLLMLTACVHSSADPSPIPANAAPVRIDSAIAGITITSEGDTVASYSSHTPDAVLHTDMLLIEMNSPDSRFSFMAYIGGSRSGKYAMDQRQQRGKATISIFQDGDGLPARLISTDGQLLLTGMNGKSCSGQFSGSVKDQQGKRYDIRGQFSSVTVRNIQPGK